jgi:hypothetical protein
MIGNVFKNLLTIENDDYRIMHSKLDDVNTLRNRTCDITYDAYENKRQFFYFSTIIRRISVGRKVEYLDHKY